MYDNIICHQTRNLLVISLKAAFNLKNLYCLKSVAFAIIGLRPSYTSSYRVNAQQVLYNNSSMHYMLFSLVYCAIVNLHAERGNRFSSLRHMRKFADYMVCTATNKALFGRLEGKKKVYDSEG